MSPTFLIKLKTQFCDSEMQTANDRMHQYQTRLSNGQIVLFVPLLFNFIYFLLRLFFSRIKWNSFYLLFVFLSMRFTIRFVCSVFFFFRIRQFARHFELVHVIWLAHFLLALMLFPLFYCRILIKDAINLEKKTFVSVN